MSDPATQSGQAPQNFDVGQNNGSIVGVNYGIIELWKQYDGHERLQPILAAAVVYRFLRHFDIQSNKQAMERDVESLRRVRSIVARPSFEAEMLSTNEERQMCELTGDCLKLEPQLRELYGTLNTGETMDNLPQSAGEVRHESGSALWRSEVETMKAKIAMLLRLILTDDTSRIYQHLVASARSSVSVPGSGVTRPRLHTDGTAQHPLEVEQFRNTDPTGVQTTLISKADGVQTPIILQDSDPLAMASEDSGRARESLYFTLGGGIADDFPCTPSGGLVYRHTAVDVTLSYFAVIQ